MKLPVNLYKIWTVISTAVVFITVLFVIYLILPISSSSEYKYHNVMGKDTTVILGNGKYEIFNLHSDRGMVAMNTLVSDFVHMDAIMYGTEKYRQVDNILILSEHCSDCCVPQLPCIAGLI